MLRPVGVLFICAILASVTIQAVSQDHRKLLLSLLPGEDVMQGWSRTDTARVYEGEDLFSFIDGGAVLFFEYGFERVVATEFQNARSETINLEIYEMKDPAAAYGIYSVRSGEHAVPITIGQEGSVRPQYIMFWKNNFYVSVAGSDSTTLCRMEIEAIGREVDRHISGQGQKPRVVELLPKEGLLTARYFRGVLGLSTVYTFDVRDIVQAVDGAIGTYHDHTLFLLNYGSEPEAQRHMANIEQNLQSSERFRQYRVQSGIAAVSDNKNRTLCFGRSGAYVVVALSSEETVAISSCRKLATSRPERLK